jgi:hypothetical protein
VSIKENREECMLMGRGVQRENRRKRSKKLGRGAGGWEKKIHRQGEKCTRKEIDGMD